MHVVYFCHPLTSETFNRTPEENAGGISERIPIAAFSLAPALPIKQLLDSFPGARIRAQRAHLAAEYGDKKIVFCFDFGAVVLINVVPAERKAILERITTHLSDTDPQPSFDEDFLIEINPALESFGTVHFHHVAIPALTRPIAEVIARLLAQSAAVERYEVELDDMIVALQGQTHGMSKHGRVGARRKTIMRLIAKTIATKNRIIGKLSLLDKPELAWESEQIDHLHDQLRAMLELDDRFQAVEYKLRAVHETVTLLLNVLQSQQALILEATIVVLIAVEIALALFHVI